MSTYSSESVNILLLGKNQEKGKGKLKDIGYYDLMFNIFNISEEPLGINVHILFDNSTSNDEFLHSFGRTKFQR